jgi:hypothetical protein
MFGNQTALLFPSRVWHALWFPNIFHADKSWAVLEKTLPGSRKVP